MQKQRNVNLKLIKKMRRKIITSLVVLAVSAVSGYGVSKQLNSENDVLQTLTLSNVEALVQDESYERNSFWMWFTQGIYKNEKAIENSCPSYEATEYNIDFKGFKIERKHIQTNPETRKDIRCTDGYTNCSEIKC